MSLVVISYVVYVAVSVAPTVLDDVAARNAEPLPRL